MKDTPVSIPNTEVKLQNADSSWRNASCEGRKLPCLLCGSSSVVEHHLAMVGVAGSNPVFRLITFDSLNKRP